MGLILASGSPRRRELLETAGIQILAVEPSNIPEEQIEGEGAIEYCRRLAFQKSKVSDRAGHWVLSADTIVVKDGAIYEKPNTPDDAMHMLTLLSDGWHEVISAWSLRYVPNLDEVEVIRDSFSISKVRFRELKSSEIASYIATGEPFDKAGGYGIQGKGAALVQEIEGSYSNIVGLPLAEVISALRDLRVIE